MYNLLLLYFLHGQMREFTVLMKVNKVLRVIIAQIPYSAEIKTK